MEKQLLDQRIGTKLREVRKEKKLSQKDVAKKMQLDFSHLSKIEKGQISSLDSLNSLCTFYEIPLVSLFADETSELPKKEPIISQVIIKPAKQEPSVSKDWLSFIKEMEKQNLSPKDLKRMVTTLKTLKTFSEKL